MLSKIKAVVHYNRSNMAAKQTLEHGWASIHCIGLIVNSALNESSISKAVGAAKNLAEYFRRRELVNSKLKEKQQQMNIPEDKLIHKVSTR